MPRGPRKRSHSGIYHFMLRGTNKQRIFHDEEDYATFLVGLRKYRELCQARNTVIRPMCWAKDQIERKGGGSVPRL